MIVLAKYRTRTYIENNLLEKLLMVIEDIEEPTIIEVRNCEGNQN